MGMLLLQVISPSLLCHRMIESEMVIVLKGMTGIPHASFDLSLAPEYSISAMVRYSFILFKRYCSEISAN